MPWLTDIGSQSNSEISRAVLKWFQLTGSAASWTRMCKRTAKATRRQNIEDKSTIFGNDTIMKIANGRKYDSEIICK